MEFGKHLGTGLWGIGDKSLTVVYGVAFVLLVIRVLPESELGNFVLLQELFLIVTGLANALALQPMLKFHAEESQDYRGIITSALLYNAGFVVVTSCVIVLFSEPIGALLNSKSLGSLLWWLPPLMVASFARNFTLVLLQSRLRMQALFWTDAAHFLGFPTFILVISQFDPVNTAMDLVHINMITFSVSSVVGIVLCKPYLKLTIHIPPEDLRRVWNYGVYTLGGIVSYLFYAKADSFILSSFTGPVQVAVYTSVKIFVRVYEMVTQVVQMFVFPLTSRFASRNDFGRLQALTEKAITFTTVGLLPVTVLFAAFAPTLIGTVYHGKYLEAAPLLQVFSLLTFCVPFSAVATNVIMGLGHARLGFVIGLQLLAISVGLYFSCTWLFGVTGTAIGYLLSSITLAVASGRYLVRFVPLHLTSLFRRTQDIKVFLFTRLGRLR
jgi:O-antigen/teichoic acid export membrane protein